MRDISLHLMDIIQNSITAGASRIITTIKTEKEQGQLLISIIDNGKGMSEEMLDGVTDPFVTSRTTRKVGLGIPLFKETAELSGGYFNIKSVEGKGTEVRAAYGLHHIDRLPLGDVAQTFCDLILSFPTRVFVLNLTNLDNHFTLDTEEILRTLGDVPITSFEVIDWMKEYINESLKHIFGGVLDEIIS